jgi:hypothetical protein
MRQCAASVAQNTLEQTKAFHSLGALAYPVMLFSGVGQVVK